MVAKRGNRGTGEITYRLLNPYPLSDADREELRRLASHGVFVSDHLGLTGNRITDAGLEHLRTLAQLGVLDLGYARVTDEGVQKLQQALPKCEIRR